MALKYDEKRIAVQIRIVKLNIGATCEFRQQQVKNQELKGQSSSI